jgi:ribosomal protein S1
MKALEPDPWDTDMDLAEGDLVMGTVRTLMPYGAFIEIIPGVEGLIHISEISYKRIHHPKDLLQEGQELEVKVLEINKEQRRISLSLKEVPVSAEADSAPPEQETIRSGNLIRRRVKAETSETTGLGDNGSGLPGFAEGKSATSPEKAVPLTPQVGLTVKGIIRSIKPYGYFVDLPDLGSHQRGLLHNSQLEVSDMGRALKGLKEGDEIQVEIIKIDDQGRISLSRKSILENQDRADLKDYRDQAKESGKFGTMADLFKKKSRR